MNRIAIGAVALLALVGSLTAVNAADAVEVATPAAEAPVDMPRFAPSEEDFDAAFVKYDRPPSALSVPDHAVDLETIEPAQAEDLGTGIASYYGKRFAGRPTASGEAFDPQQHTAAHRTLPFGSKVRVTNPRNGRSVVVRINDRGPFVKGRTIDLSRGAAEEVGIVAAGHGTVQLALLSD
nr:septal ring lytic transglycosylase RlpA family protein [Croceibacterium atlanticum]